jgi:hypothetical protein
LHRNKEERNFLYTVKLREPIWIGNVLRKNCLIKPVVEGKIKGAAGGRRRRKQLLDDLKKTRGYWNLKEEELDRTLWRTSFEEAIDQSRSCLQSRQYNE